MAVYRGSLSFNIATDCEVTSHTFLLLWASVSCLSLYESSFTVDCELILARLWLLKLTACAVILYCRCKGCCKRKRWLMHTQMAAPNAEFGLKVWICMNREKSIHVVFSALLPVQIGTCSGVEFSKLVLREITQHCVSSELQQRSTSSKSGQKIKRNSVWSCQLTWSLPTQ